MSNFIDRVRRACAGFLSPKTPADMFAYLRQDAEQKIFDSEVERLRAEHSVLYNRAYLKLLEQLNPEHTSEGLPQ